MVGLARRYFRERAGGREWLCAPLRTRPRLGDRPAREQPRDQETTARSRVDGLERRYPERRSCPLGAENGRAALYQVGPRLAPPPTMARADADFPALASLRQRHPAPPRPLRPVECR